MRGAPPEWQVTYETEDITEAMGMCAADLDRLDPRWPETFDVAQPSPFRRSLDRAPVVARNAPKADRTGPMSAWSATGGCASIGRCDGSHCGQRSSSA